MHSHKRVASLADYEGMKVRTSGAWAEIAQTLGAVHGHPARRRGLSGA